MLHHLRHVLWVAAALLVAAVPAWFADPAVQSLVAHHPGVAVYIPLAGGVVHALLAAYKRRRASGGTP